MDDNIHPDIMRELEWYWQEGIPTGDYLASVLRNDLFEAMARADDRNLLSMRSLVRYIHMELPIACWGNGRAVREWIQKGGMKGEKTSNINTDAN